MSVQETYYTKLISVRVEQDTIKKIDEFAAIHVGIGRSLVINLLLRAAIEEGKLSSLL